MTDTSTLNVPHALEKMINAMPECAYMFSSDGKLLAWNKNVEVLSEFSGEELEFKFLTELIHKDDRDRIAEKFVELMAEGDDKERIIQYNIVTKSEKIIPCLALRSVVVVDGTTYMVGILSNISGIQNNKEDIAFKIAKINSLKKQLQEHYHNIERLNQNAIELKKNLFLNTKEFNNILIDKLSGIFFLCEIIDSKFYINRWNSNFETVLEYTPEELLNMQPHQIFTNKKEYEKVEKAIRQIFMTGSAQGEAIFNTKAGQSIPFLFEGYLLEDMGKSYFMVLGMDRSDQIAMEEKHKRQKVDNQKAKKLLETNERELVTTALQISKTSNIIESTLKNINMLLDKHSEVEICNDLLKIKNKLKSQIIEQDNWEIFKLSFTKVHKVFFEKLKSKHPELSKSETKFCAYLRIHLSSYQISSALNVTNEAIKKTRYRIRKKMKLSPKDSLEDYISKF